MDQYTKSWIVLENLLKNLHKIILCSDSERNEKQERCPVLTAVTAPWSRPQAGNSLPNPRPIIHWLDLIPSWVSKTWLNVYGY